MGCSCSSKFARAAADNAALGKAAKDKSEQAGAEKDVLESSTQAKGFRSFRIQNLGKPHHLCCSGIELYGVLSTCLSIDLMHNDVIMPDGSTLADCGLVESNMPLELTDVVKRRAFNFESVTRDCFDTNGVLYAFGSNFGKDTYTSPMHRGIQMRFSRDGDNFYSRGTGHAEREPQWVTSVILGHRHPGDNATAWSKGAPNAWFQIDLPEGYWLQANHYCYRGDYGGGENHPRTWSLQGSRDGCTWVTLRSHENDRMVTMHQAGSWSIPEI